MAYKVNDARQTFFKYLHITEQDVEFIEEDLFIIYQKKKNVLFLYIR